MSEHGLRVLVVDDEKAIRRFLRTSLTANGYSVFEAENGAEALAAVVTHRPDVVILDLGLPDMDGIEVTARLREWMSLPIIVLSVRSEEADKIMALDAGADDYLTKPFGMGELLARIRGVMRRAAPTDQVEAVFVTAELMVDLARRVVQVRGQEVQLTPTEYDLLRVLVNHAGRVLTHQHLLREVWGTGSEVAAQPQRWFHLLRVNISNLRRKLELNPSRPRYILSEPGVGYRLNVNLLL